MAEIGIDLRIFFGKPGEMRETFGLTVTLDGDKRRLGDVTCWLRKVVLDVLGPFSRQEAGHFELELSQTLGEV